MSQITIDRDRFNDMFEEMCEKYCYWPINSSSDAVLESHCNECPLNCITCDDYWEEQERNKDV